MSHVEPYHHLTDPAFKAYFASPAVISQLNALSTLLRQLKPTARVTILHDHDQDGWAARTLLNAYLTTQGFSRIEYFPIPHGDAFTRFDRELLGDTLDVLFILDLGVSETLAASFLPLVKHLVVIDHHLGTVEALPYGVVIATPGWSATALTEGVLRHLTGAQDDGSLLAAVIDHGDLYRHGKIPEQDEIVKTFFSHSYFLGMEQTPWDAFLREDAEAMRAFYTEARQTYALERRQVESIAQRKYVCKTLFWEGECRIFALVFTSMYENEVATELLTRIGDDIDFVALVRTGTQSPCYRVSLRSDDAHMDISRLAQYLGGGGHRNAAGCTLSFESFVRYAQALRLSL